MADRLPPEVLANRQRGLQAADWYDRLVGARAALLEELTRIEQCDLAQQALDLPRLRGLVVQLGRDNVNRVGQQFAQYRGVLERGLMTGSFIRWVEENR
jgi:asparagine synthase (glutamine-hydrolysing)